MELISKTNEETVRLSPIAYQFPKASDLEDRNWLEIEGAVKTLSENWTFTEPALQTWDLIEIAVWLRKASAGLIKQTSVNKDGRVNPALMFAEPCIGFSVARRSGDEIGLRVHLWADAAPPSSHHSIRHPNMNYFVELSTTAAGLEAAAHELDREAQSFPPRGKR